MINENLNDSLIHTLIDYKVIEPSFFPLLKRYLKVNVASNLRWKQ